MSARRALHIGAGNFDVGQCPVQHIRTSMMLSVSSFLLLFVAVLWSSANALQVQVESSTCTDFTFQITVTAAEYNAGSLLVIVPSGTGIADGKSYVVAGDWHHD